MRKEVRKEMHQVERQEDASLSCVINDLLCNQESTPCSSSDFTIFQLFQRQYNSAAQSGYMFVSSLTFHASEVGSRFLNYCTDSLCVVSFSLHCTASLHCLPQGSAKMWFVSFTLNEACWMQAGPWWQWVFNVFTLLLTYSHSIPTSSAPWPWRSVNEYLRRLHILCVVTRWYSWKVKGQLYSWNAQWTMDTQALLAAMFVVSLFLVSSVIVLWWCYLCKWNHQRYGWT